MKVQKLLSINDVIETFCDLPNNYIFRGHADSTWHLESTLERLIGSDWSKENADRFEQFSLQEFQSKYHLYNRENIQPESKLAWLSLMQHYGVQTRLLDFTESPFVAIYFAIESYNPQVKSDFAVFSVNYSELMKRSIEYICENNHSFNETYESVCQKKDDVFAKVVDQFEYDIAWVTEPGQLNVRLDRQAGSFLLSGNKGLKVEQVLNSSVYSDCDFTQYILPGELYEQLYALLRKMNINSKSIYGDLQGLARSLKMEMSVHV